MHGRRKYNAAIALCVGGSVLIACIYVVSFIFKHNILNSDEPSAREAEVIDACTFVVYFFQMFTLLGSLFYFKVIERRHNMQIKTLQLFLAIVMCLTTSLLGIFQLSGLLMILNLTKDSA